MVRVLSDRSGSQPPVGDPERFRVRLAGRIDQVWIPPLDAKPVYRAELVVAKSRLLQRVSPLAVRFLFPLLFVIVLAETRSV